MSEQSRKFWKLYGEQSMARNRIVDYRDLSRRILQAMEEAILARFKNEPVAESRKKIAGK